jgi:transcriptional regulator with XRE-family HTH domain
VPFLNWYLYGKILGGGLTMPNNVELPDIFKTVKVKGKLIDSFELRWLISLGVKERLHYIRTFLEALYPGEFSFDKVGVRGGLSHQAVRDAETDRKGVRDRGKSHKPSIDTIEKLAAVYNVPELVFSDEASAEEVGGFYLGKKEDEQSYFDDHHLTFRKVHPLDKRGAAYFNRGKGEEYTYVSQYSPTQNDEEYAFEVLIQAYHTSTYHLLWERRVGNQYKVLPEDIDMLADIFKKELQHMADRYQLLKGIREDAKLRNLFKKFSDLMKEHDAID